MGLPHSASSVQGKPGPAAVTGPTGTRTRHPRLCAGHSRNKGPGQRYPPPRGRAAAGESPILPPCLAQGTRDAVPEKNQLFSVSLRGGNSISTPARPCSAPRAPAPLDPAPRVSPGTEDKKIKSLRDQLTGSVPGEEPRAAATLHLSPTPTLAPGKRGSPTNPGRRAGIGGTTNSR